MLHLHNLHYLDKHVAYVQKKLDRPDVFLVGGCVRDLLLGINNNPHDLDLTLAGQPKEIANSIDKGPSSGISFFMTEKYGTMTIVPKELTVDSQQLTAEESAKLSDQGQLQYEITPFRTEGDYTDSRHPDEVNWTDNLILDSQRRDFGLNAMYYTVVPGELSNPSEDAEPVDICAVQKLLERQGVFLYGEGSTVIISDQELVEEFFPSGKFDVDAFKTFIGKHFKDLDADKVASSGRRFVVDPQGGILDIINRKIKAVGDPDKRIEEDALRIIRALRFVNVLNDKLNTLSQKDFSKVQYFDIEKQTWKSVKKNYYRIQNVAKERIKIELDKVFKRHNPAGFIGLLDEINILKYLFPALHATKGVDQPVRYHPFDVYVHSLLCLKEFQEINGDYLAKYAMLYHDVGKTEQYYSYEMGLDQDEIRKIFGTWMNHVRCGPDMVKKDFDALGFSRKEVDILMRYVANHMRVGEIVMSKKENWKKKIRKMLSEAGEEKILNLIDITIADRLGQQNPVQPPEIDDLVELEHMVSELMEEEGQFTLKKLAISGNDIMKEFNILPSSQVGELMKKAFDWVIDDINARNDKEEILKYLKG